MHPTPLAKALTGASRLVAWCKQLRRNVLERTLIAGSGVNLDYQQDGVRISLAQLKRAAGGGGKGVNFRGDWSAESTYAEDDYVFLAQGYTDANNGTDSDHYLNSLKYTGLWRSKVSNSDTVPGTDSTKWERVSDGPRHEEKIVDPAATSADEFLQLKGDGFAINNNSITGNDAVFQVGDTTWAVQIQKSDIASVLDISSTDVEGGRLEVRELFLIEEGVLKRTKALMIEPVAYSF